MSQIIYKELGFPVILTDPQMVVLRGQELPKINMKYLQKTVFKMLVDCPHRLTGDQVRFIRKYKKLRQADFAAVLNMANQSVVSQWENKNDQPTGMDYNTEVVLRLWMASGIGMSGDMADLLATRLKGLKKTPGALLTPPMAA